ncbi:ribosome biogenesis GTPase Der [Umboniibacter marinipuniceus]|uniref:GTPase Der n=1 Tax=Umboniibacter marinipuniceus TaxID=569599 RepID=A0A3M0A776_9GAMM|nr:ribosome biogenesis GTPase Der [Umboniibacter marinipuniceus]RMA79389.1 GTP-binding protein [Umboniibacter marinipuniceus]
MIPVIALVGRPNVGKSTLFNQLTKSRDALVADYSGLTRDRKYGNANYEGRKFVVVDTGGISGDEQGIDRGMADQSLAAIEEADRVFFLVDCRAGMTATDEMIAEHLRSVNKPVYLVVNKIDGLHAEAQSAEFFALGLGELHLIAASHGRGIKQLIEDALEDIPESVVEEDEEDDAARGIRMAIVGRPNVGKSTLVNRLLGEDRVVVYDHPGTTRDSIYIDYERNDQSYTIIDTAGVRRRKSIRETVEKFSIVKSLQAIDDANVVVLVMDASEGLVDQDLHLLGHCIKRGRALVVALNKWDGLPEEQRDYVKKELNRRLVFLDYADIHFISALHGTGVGHLYESIDAAYESATQKLNTNQVTRILEDAVATHPPPLVNGRRIKLRYAHAGGQNPPLIVIHGNQTDKVPASYVRYLEKTFRRVLKLAGTPLRLEFKGNENPFEHKKPKLVDRQVNRKRGLKSHKNKEKAKAKLAGTKKPARKKPAPKRPTSR